jgi:hypothetical protein
MRKTHLTILLALDLEAHPAVQRGADHTRIESLKNADGTLEELLLGTSSPSLPTTTVALTIFKCQLGLPPHLSGSFSRFQGHTF